MTTFVRCRCGCTRFVFRVHLSGSFFILHSFTSTLYLTLCRMFHRDYVRATELIESLDLDGSLDAEQLWLLQQFAHLQDDQSPDMHACRVKLSLALQFSPNAKLPWDRDAEYSKYQATTHHVRVRCRLDRAAETHLVGGSRADLLRGIPVQVDVSHVASHGRGSVNIFNYVKRAQRVLGLYAAGRTKWKFRVSHDTVTAQVSGTAAFELVRQVWEASWGAALGPCMAMLTGATQVVLDSSGNRDCSRSMGLLLTWICLKKLYASEHKGEWVLSPGSMLSDGQAYAAIGSFLCAARACRARLTAMSSYAAGFRLPWRRCWLGAICWVLVPRFQRTHWHFSRPHRAPGAQKVPWPTSPRIWPRCCPNACGQPCCRVYAAYLRVPSLATGACLREPFECVVPEMTVLRV